MGRLASAYGDVPFVGVSGTGQRQDIAIIFEYQGGKYLKNGDSAPIGKEKVITKDTVPSPANCYSDSKLQTEKGIIPLQDDSFKVCILRPPMIYGKGGKGNFPTLEKMADKLPIFPKVENKRSMLYVGNLVEFVRLMIENEEEGTFWPQNAEYSNSQQAVRGRGSEIGWSGYQ